MSKVTEKATAKTKKVAPKKVTKPKKEAAPKIEAASITALKKLQELGINHQLQADLEWCLGSYKYDKNPAGLLEMSEKALNVLKEEKAKKTKGVTSKLLTDLEKALKQN